MRPGFGPVAPFERRLITPRSTRRHHPLLDVAHEVLHAVLALAARARSAGFALVQAKRFDFPNPSFLGVEFFLAVRHEILRRVARVLVVSMSVGPRLRAGTFASQLPFELAAETF